MTREEIAYWIKESLKASGLTQAGLAAALSRAVRKNIDRAAVNKMLITEPGKKSRNVSANELLAISVITGHPLPDHWTDVSSEDVAGAGEHLRSEDVAALLPTPPAPKVVKLKGYVGAGSEMHYYRLADEEYEEVPAPPNANNKTVAVEIRGVSMGPHLAGWLVFYSDIHSPVSEALYGRLCVVGLSDDRILVKRIQPQKNGLHSLLSNSVEPPIQDAVIEWAAPVTALMPRE